MMETVFYEDNASHLNHYFTAGMNSINQLKRKMTLDLDFGSTGVGGNGNNSTVGNSKQTSVIKKARVASLNTPLCGPVLNSPDLSKLNMSSPEFEKFVIQQTSTLPTPTPNQSQIFFPKNVTEEQEQYVRGFTDALTKLRESQGNGTENNNNNNNNVNTIVSVSVSNANSNTNAVNTSIATSIQQQLVQTGPTVTSNSTIQLINPSQPQQQIQLELIQQQVNLNQHSHQPPPYTYNNSSDDDDSDDMSENSCSNSTTSSSTYTTNGHVSVPGSQQVTFSGHHRLPDYQLAMGATGTSGNTPAASAAAIGSFGSSIHIKEEPHQAGSNPSSPALSPIDMASQEKIKLERKRQRNRVAASKCRKRKLERISKLEDKVKQLKGENSDLTNVLTKLKETVCSLKQQVLTHVNSGCTLMLSSNQVVTSSSSF